MIKKIYISVLCLLVTLSSWAGSTMQWVDIDRKDFSTRLEALNKLIARLEHCEVNMTDASYENYSTSDYHEQNRGYYRRNENEFHTFMLGIHTIQNKEFRLVIDTAKKIIMVGDPTNAMSNVFDASVYAALLKGCTTIRTAQSEGYTYYRMEFKQGYPISAYEFSMKDSLPQKIVIYYSKEQKKGDIVGKPRAEVIFSNWKTSSKLGEQEFNLERYVYRKGDTFFLKAPYEGKYKLLDERVLSKTAKK